MIYLIKIIMSLDEKTNKKSNQKAEAIPSGISLGSIG